MKSDIKKLNILYEKSLSTSDNLDYNFGSLDVIKDFVSENLYNLLKDFSFTPEYLYKLMDYLGNYNIKDTFLFILYLFFEDIKKYYRQENYTKIFEIFENIYVKLSFVKFKNFLLDQRDLKYIFEEIRSLSNSTNKYFGLISLDYLLHLERIVIENFIKWYFTEGYLYIYVNIDKYLERLIALYQLEYGVNNKDDLIIDKKINDIVKNYKKEIEKKNENIAFVKLKSLYNILLRVNNFSEFFDYYRVFDNILIKLINGEYLNYKYQFNYLIKVLGIDFDILEEKFKFFVGQFLEVIKHHIKKDNIYINEYLLDYLGKLDCISGTTSKSLISNTLFVKNENWCRFNLRNLYIGDVNINYGDFMEVYHKILNLVFKIDIYKNNIY